MLRLPMSGWRMDDRRHVEPIREPLGGEEEYGESSSSLLEHQEHTGLLSWDFEALVFSTSFRTGFDVQEFQTILPKNLIHRVVPGEPVFDFFEAWKASARETLAMKTYGAKQWFSAAAERATRPPPSPSGG